MRSRLFHILLFRPASAIGANIDEIVGENTRELIGIAAEVSRPTLRFQREDQVRDRILSGCLSRHHKKREEEGCQHAARAPNGARLRCGALKKRFIPQSTRAANAHSNRCHQPSGFMPRLQKRIGMVKLRTTQRR